MLPEPGTWETTQAGASGRICVVRRRGRLVEVLVSIPRHLFFAAAAFWLLGLSAPAARAEFTICNQSLDVFNVAIGYDRPGGFQTEGWWVVGANRCVDLITEPLTSRYVYIHVEDVFGRNALSGSVRACVGEGKFAIREARECWQHGFIEAMFKEVDTREQERWTYILNTTE